jgi:hypothetical protein
MKNRALVAAAAFALSTVSLSAQTPAQTPARTPPQPPPIHIHRAEGPITVDGRLDDEGWKTAAKIDTFYETSPGDNNAPAVKTTAWLSFDDRYFYIGVRCDDPHPEKIRAPYVERDAVIGTDDNIAILLDTRNDKRTAMEFRVNPRGIQGDAVYNDANGSEDFSPDFFYDTAATIDGSGWSAEYRIPFSSLRYPDGDVQKWNIIIWRNYPRDFRYAYQNVPIARDSNCYICHVQEIEGLTNIPKAGHLVAAPYVTAQQLAQPEGELGSPLKNGDAKFDGGLDVKYTPTANQVLDLTINPDFSQVESDVAQITVNQRFAVFFPEKRPFFLEGFDLFDTPFQVAYTRTITDPNWGVRSTGKFGTTGYTVLVTGDKGGGLTIIPGPLGSDFAPSDFKATDTIARVRHDIGQSFVGAVLTDREVREGGHNRVFGPDFQWRPSQSNNVVGEILLSQNENPNRPDLSPDWNGSRSTSHSAYLAWNHFERTKDWFVEGYDVGKSFRADLGFIPQNGYRQIDGGFGIRRFPEKGLFRFVRTSIFVDQQSAVDGGGTLFRQVSLAVNTQGAKNLALGVAIRPSEQSLVNGKLLEQTYLNFAFQIDPSRRYTRVGLTGHAGEAIDFANGRVGRGASLNLTATVRPIDKLTLDSVVSDEWLNVAGGRLYTATVERLKATYSFSANSLLRVIGQYVSTNRAPERYLFPVSPHSSSFLGSILYSYKLNWQTVLFLGYGDDRVLNQTTNDLVKLDRSLFFKVSYALQR